MDFGNGCFKPIPGGDIWSPLVPNGKYGVVTPIFGSLGNAHTTPQIRGETIIKGNGFVRYESPDGYFTVVSNNGLVTSGTKPF